MGKDGTLDLDISLNNENPQAIGDLNFLGSSGAYHKRIEQTILCDSHNQMSDDTKFYFIVFHSLFCVYFITLLVYVVVCIEETALLAFHLTFVLSFLIAGGILCAYFSRNFKKAYGNYRKVYGIFGFLLLVYLGASDLRFQSLLSAGSREDYSCVQILSMAIYLSVLSKLCIFKVYFFMNVYTVAFIFCLSSFTSEKTKVLAEQDCLFLLVILSMQLILTYKRSLKVLKIFYQKTEEKKLLAYRPSIPTLESIKVDSQAAFLYLDNVLSNIKNIYNLLFLRKVKKKLKDIIQNIEHIKNFIVSRTKEVSFGQIPLKSKQFLEKFFSENRIPETSHRPVSLKNVEMACPMFIINDFCDFQLDGIMYSIGEEWDIDIDYVEAATGHTIMIFAKYLLQKWPVTALYSIEDTTVDSYFQSVEDAYADNFFHSKIHAAEVLHNFMYFFNESKVIMLLDSVEYLSVLIACLGHDAGRTANTNLILRSTRDPLTILYNDKNVQENMTCAILFSLLQESDKNILEGLNEEHLRKARSIIIALILHSSLDKHFQVLAKFKLRGLRISEFNSDTLEDTILALSMALKCADLGFLAKPIDTHIRWTDLLQEEFFLQGDIQRDNQLPVNAFCTREEPKRSQFALTLIQYLGIPMYHEWALFLRSSRTEAIVEDIKRNEDHWLKSL